MNEYEYSDIKNIQNTNKHHYVAGMNILNITGTFLQKKVKIITMLYVCLSFVNAFIENKKKHALTHNTK